MGLVGFRKPLHIKPLEAASHSVINQDLQSPLTDELTD